MARTPIPSTLFFGEVIQTNVMDVHILKQRKSWNIWTMFTTVKKFAVYAWNFVFNHEISPLRHIPDISIRHYVLQVLGFMWAVSFAVATGSYTFLAASVVGHSVLIGAAAITVATWTAATVKPELFVRGSIRQKVDR